MTEAPWMVAPASEVTLPDPLLRTKIFMPGARPELLPRPRLLAVLDEGMAHPLTLVSAPAGFGKTTLLSDWARRGSAAVAWVSLDEGDNDLVRFWSYAIAALQTVRPGIGEGALAMFRSLRPLSIHSPLAALLNEIAAGPVPLALVLDDYHLIESQGVHDSLTYLLDHLPPQMHLVISCRAEPPLPLARLRGRGQLAELRPADLRFTRDEIATFLNQVMGLGLSEEDVSTLAARTEGWIAGLQLAAQSLRQREDASRFVAAFAGDNRHILDYLTEEVLQQQPESVQSFLMQTAILDCMCGPLCDAVTGRKDSQAILESMEAANLFLMPLDDQRQQYRYHPLFADLLRRRLHSHQPDWAATLHRRASAWYEGECMIGAAIRHALAAGDTDRAVGLAEEHSDALIRYGELTEVLEWLEALPGEVVRAHPQLSIAYAWVLLHSGQVNAVEPRLQDAERALEQCAEADMGMREVERLRTEIALIRPLTARCQGDPRRMLDLVEAAFRQVPAEDAHTRGLLHLNRGDALLERGDLGGAIQSYAEALPLCQAAGDALGAMQAAYSMISLYPVQGKLHRAAEVFRQARDWCQEQYDQDGCRSPAEGLIHVGMAGIFYEWNELDAAEEHLREGLAPAGSSGHLELLRDGHAVLAWVRYARGDARGALQAMDRAEQVTRQADLPRYVSKMAARRARLCLALGDLESAVRWAHDLEARRGGEPDDLYEYLTLPAARVRIAQAWTTRDESYLQGVLPLLERRLQEATAAGHVDTAIVILGLQAQVWQLQSRIQRALEALGHALALGEPEGYIRTFVDMGEPMAALLRQAVARGVMPHYAGRILAAMPPGEQEAVARPAAGVAPLAEPLSERELVVLRLAAAGLTNPEIAAELVLSLNTVKTHTRSIYSKLGVRNRTQALRRARELTLL